jgi:hypothetical protein
MKVADLTEPAEFYVLYYYVNEGGSSNWGARDETMAGPVELVPGEEARLDFSVEGPFEANVRFLDESGQPLDGLSWLLRRAGGRGGCGNDVAGPDGQQTIHGLKPDVTYEIVGRLPIESPSGFDTAFLGLSEPFSGASGDSIDVSVICRSPESVGFGGVRAVVADAAANPLGSALVTCVVDAVDTSEYIEITTNADGTLDFPDALPDGHYPSILVYVEDEEGGEAHIAQLHDIRIERGETTDLGTVALQPIAADQLDAAIRGR